MDIQLTQVNLTFFYDGHSTLILTSCMRKILSVTLVIVSLTHPQDCGDGRQSMPGSRGAGRRGLQNADDGGGT